jgi:pimeloyl-ACP methyl ester carboxylesterase
LFCEHALRPHSPALFRFPGVAGGAALWRWQQPALAEHYRVYARDMPGGRREPLK